MKQPTTIAFTALATITLPLAVASADLVAGFVDGNDHSPLMPPYAEHADVVASDVDNTAFTAAPVRDNWVGTDLGGYWITSGHNGTNPADIGPQASQAEIADAAGYSWTVTADPGLRIHVESVALEFGIVAQLASPPADWGYRLFLDVDGTGFQSVGSDAAFDELPEATFVEKTPRRFPFSASTIAGGTLTLKLVDWGKISANNNQFGSSANTFRNLRINGTVSTSETAPGTVELLSLEFDDTSRRFNILYRTTFPQGVDIYRSENLIDWVSDGSEPATGENLLIERQATVPSQSYILIESGKPFPNP